MTPTTSQIRIRAAAREDIDIIADFNAAMARETESKILKLEILRAGVSAIFDEPSRGFYRVAQIDNRVVGCLMITFEWSDWRNGNWWWFQSVYVHPDYRRAGVFRAMFADVECAARATPRVVGLRLYVEKQNAHAQSTYASLGMHEAEYAMYAMNIDQNIAPR